jgi:hypothetical protein
MNTTKLQIADELKLDATCHAALIRLVELRIGYDVDQEKAELDEAEVKADKLENKKDGWFKDFRKGRSEKKASQLKELIAQKERWGLQWAEGAWKGVRQIDEASCAALQGASLKQLRERIETSDELRLKRYLVLQEAALVQLYTGFEGYDEDLEELDVKEGCDIMGRHLGFPSKGGRQILKDVKSLIKGATGFWDQFGDEIESLFKSDDLVAAAVGDSIGSIRSESLITAAAKLIGYARFLADQIGEDKEAASAARVRLVDQFVTFKHRAERSMVDGSLDADDVKQALKNLEVLEYAFRELVKDATGSD